MGRARRGSSSRTRRGNGIKLWCKRRRHWLKCRDWRSCTMRGNYLLGSWMAKRWMRVEVEITLKETTRYDHENHQRRIGADQRPRQRMVSRGTADAYAAEVGSKSSGTQEVLPGMNWGMPSCAEAYKGNKRRGSQLLIAAKCKRLTSNRRSTFMLSTHVLNRAT